jgi:hypothetical protein
VTKNEHTLLTLQFFFLLFQESCKRAFINNIVNSSSSSLIGKEKERTEENLQLHDTSATIHQSNTSWDDMEVENSSQQVSTTGPSKKRKKKSAKKQRNVDPSPPILKIR